MARYILPSSNELHMTITFHHVDIDGGVESPLKPIKWTLSAFKGIIDKWQTYTHQVGGWNSIFIENHDQGRSVSRFGNDSDEYRTISAKMLAVLHISQGGTVYIYQGQEIAMANVPKHWGIEEYKDVATQSHWARYAILYISDAKSSAWTTHRRPQCVKRAQKGLGQSRHVGHLKRHPHKGSRQRSNTSTSTLAS